MVETKRPSNTPTEAQRRFMDEWRRYGGLGIVAERVEEVDRLLALIEGLGR